MGNVESKSGDSTPLPEGEYTIAASSVEETTTKNDDVMIKVTFEVTKAPKYNGYKIFENFVWSEASAWKIKQVLEMGGSPLADDVDLTVNKFIKWLNKGVVVGGYVVSNTYTDKNGQKKDGNKIKYFFDPKSTKKAATTKAAPASDEDDEEDTGTPMFK